MNPHLKSPPGGMYSPIQLLQWVRKSSWWCVPLNLNGSYRLLVLETLSSNEPSYLWFLLHDTYADYSDLNCVWVR